MNVAIRDGIIGPVKETNKNSRFFQQILPDGTNQYEFVNYWDKNWKDLIEEVRSERKTLIK